MVSEAVKALYALESKESYAACDDAVRKCLDEGGESAIYICSAIIHCKMRHFSAQVMELIGDSRPSVRAAAIECLGELQCIDAIPNILCLLPTADQEMVKVCQTALSSMGKESADFLLNALPEPYPIIWNACMMALTHILNEQQVRDMLIEPCIAKLNELHQQKPLQWAVAKLGMDDLAELSRQRYKEVRSVFCESAWKYLFQAGR